MPRIKPSPEHVEQLLAGIPEGFIRDAIFARRFRIHNNAHKSIVSAIRTGKVGQDGNLLYDATRMRLDIQVLFITIKQVIELCHVKSFTILDMD